MRSVLIFLLLSQHFVWNIEVMNITCLLLNGDCELLGFNEEIEWETSVFPISELQKKKK